MYLHIVGSRCIRSPCCIFVILHCLESESLGSTIEVVFDMLMDLYLHPVVVCGLVLHARHPFLMSLYFVGFFV